MKVVAPPQGLVRVALGLQTQNASHVLIQIHLEQKVLASANSDHQPRSTDIQLFGVFGVHEGVVPS
jgi:hypothetical protein